MFSTPMRPALAETRHRSGSVPHLRSNRRIPIFSARRSPTKLDFNLCNTMHVRQNQQVQGHSNLIGFDSCGCENRMTVC